jgi:peptide deformylase
MLKSPIYDNMKKVMKIIRHPDPALRKKSKPLEAKKITDSTMQDFCLCMEKTMLEKDGIGLAAPQVGKNIRLVVINTKEGPIAMFNPKFIKKSWTKETSEEGCLSVPDVFGQVSRHQKINLEFTDKTGRKISLEASGLMARVIQHEVDHLDGILFIDKAKNVKKIEK